MNISMFGFAGGLGCWGAGGILITSSGRWYGSRIAMLCSILPFCGDCLFAILISLIIRPYNSKKQMITD